MRALSPAAGVGDLDPVRAAVVCGAVSGGLSVALPFLVGLTEALGALAVAGWVAAFRRAGFAARSLLRPPAALRLLAVTGGAVASLGPLGPFAPLRGVFLAVGLLPLEIATRWGVPTAGAGAPA